MCFKHWSKVLFLILIIYTNSFSFRNERLFFPIIPFYRINYVTPTPCVGIGPEYLEGTCNTLARCRNAGLTSASPCQGNLGFCCVDIKYCGGVSSSPVVYFRNPATVAESCNLVVRKTNSSICQLRLDFNDFSLTQPTRGTCNDFLQLSLGESYLPKICGDNTGQHVYVDFLPNCDDQTLSFKFLNTSTTSKRWNIKVTQIPCNSPLAAPRGC
ncbi:uncharacterized protein [Halyomorpha halys]|uniref:uncharacterized protein n=1 Tax=Halyomorpha halys TaxID=286706 RepID=UPI0006D50FFD|nr:uncharacterized protein LOC106682015 [Halyomorpha halys]